MRSFVLAFLVILVLFCSIIVTYDFANHIGDGINIDVSVDMHITFKNTEKHSSFQCVGGVGNIPNEDEAVCRFDNICYSINRSQAYNRDLRGEFYYFTNKQSKPRQYMFNENSKLYHNLNDFSIHHAAWDLHFKLNTINDSISNFIDDQYIYWFPIDNVLFHEPLFPENFGHCLCDDWMTTYRLLNIFNAYSEDVQVMFLHYFDNIYKPYRAESKDWINRSNSCYDQVRPYLYKHPHLFLTLFENEMMRNTDAQYVCFKTAYIASDTVFRMVTPFHGQKHYHWDWDKFINVFLSKDMHKAKINKLYNQKKQRILILTKVTGRHGRTWANSNVQTEIVDFLLKLFDVDIDIMTDAQMFSMPLTHQINKMLEYTILITPPGSMSFVGLFMAPNTCIITKDVWRYKLNKSYHFESYVWDHQTSKKKFSIPTTIQDAKFWISKEEMKRRKIIPRIHHGNLNFVYRDGVNYYVDPKMLAYIVYNALDWIENRMHWSHTFTLPNNWNEYMVYA